MKVSCELKICTLCALVSFVIAAPRKLTEQEVLTELFPTATFGDNNKLNPGAELGDGKTDIVVLPLAEDPDNGTEPLAESESQVESIAISTTIVPQEEEPETVTEETNHLGLAIGNMTDEEILQSKADAIIEQMWGGSCKLEDWHRCNNITSYASLRFRENGVIKFFTMECTTFSWVCMINGWTVNRCHLLCMSVCNKELLYSNRYDNWVRHEGSCEPNSYRVPGT